MERWSLQNIKIGLDKLIGLLGRMPTATEIDQYEGLPSARHIQRKFGGIQTVRKQLGYKDVSLDRGLHRAGSAREVGVAGLELEARVYSYLKDRFGDICVHQQRPTGLGKQALDFYVYTQGGRFGVDVFCAKNLNSLRTNIRMKRKNYIDYTGKLYLVYESPTHIDPIVDGTVFVLSLAEFLEEVKSYQPYEIGTAY